MSLLDTFSIIFDSDASEVKKGAEEADKSVNKLEDSLVESDKASVDLGDSFSGMITKGAGALAGLVSIGATLTAIIIQASRTDELGKFSRSLKHNVEDAHAWSEAVTRMGGSSGSLQGSVSSLTDKLADLSITGGGAAAEVFARIGINARDSAGNVKSAFEILPELADAFENLDPDVSRGFGQRLGLDQSTILLLQQGRIAVDDLIQRQKDLGVITKEDTEAAAKFNDAWSDTKQVFTSLSVAAGTTIFPFLADMLDQLTTFGIWIGQNSDLVSGFFIGIAGILTAIYLPAIVSAVTATVAFIAPFAAVGAAVIAAGAAFALAYEDIKAFIDGNESFIGQVLDKYPAVNKAFESIRDTIEGLLGFLGDAAGLLKEFLFDGPIKFATEVAASVLGTDSPNAIASQSSAAIAAGNTTTSSRAFSFGDINVDARGGNSQEIAANGGQALRGQLEQVVSQYDDGIAR